VRQQAAESLRKLGDTSKLPPDLIKQVADAAVPALMNRVADDLWAGGSSYDPQYGGKDAALNALRVLAPQNVTTALLNALSSKTEAVRVWACGQLAGQKDHESTAGLVAALAKDEAPAVRAAAAAALAAVRPPEARALAAALGDPEGQVRQQAAESLRKLGDKSKMPPDLIKQVAEAAVPALMNRVADDRWAGGSGYDPQYGGKDAALNALRVLAPEKVQEALLLALKSNTPEVKKWATDRLADLKK
jgi:HEAT repeat protein